MQDKNETSFRDKTARIFSEKYFIFLYYNQKKKKLLSSQEYVF